MVVFLLLLNLFSFGQDQTDISALSGDKFPATAYVELFGELRKKETDEALNLLEKEIIRHEALNHTSIVVNLRIVYGKIFKKRSAAEGYIEFQKAMTEAEKAGLFYEEVLALLEMGYVSQAEGLKERAFHDYLRGIRIAESNEFADLAFKLYYAAGHLQYHADNYNEAISLLTKGLRFYTLDEWSKKELSISHDVMSSLNTIGLANARLEKFKEAIDAYEDALVIADKLKDEFWVGLIHGNMGNVYLKRAQYDSALLLLNIDLKASKQFDYDFNTASTYISIAEVLENQRLFPKAEAYFDSAGRIINRLKVPYPSYYIKRAELAYRMGKHKEAVEYGFRYKTQNDSLVQEKKSKELAMLHASFDFQNKLGEINLLEKENQLKDEELKYKNLLIYGSGYVLLISVAMIIVLLRSNRLKVRLNETLEKEVGRRTRKLAYTVKELDTVVYRLSHDFRRPLTTLIGLDSLGRSLSNNDEVKEIFEKIGKTARQMDKMLYKMTFVHEINNQKPALSEVCVAEVIAEVRQQFEEELEAPDLKYEEIVVGQLKVPTDPHFLRIIVSNLLENALVFRPEHGKRTIRLTVEKLKDEWYVEVSDNGPGIPDNILSKIYEPFFRGSPASEGNGLGLYLVRRATRRLKGRITARSVVNKGSTFTVYFPLS